MEPEAQIEVERKVDVENDVEMKDEEAVVEEGSKVSLPWAFIDCEIDSLIELVGESFATDPQAGGFLLGIMEYWTKLVSDILSHVHLISFLLFLLLILRSAHMLNKLLEHNDQVVLTPSALTRFHSRAPPGISVLDYLKRIVKYTNLEVSLLSTSQYGISHQPIFSAHNVICSHKSHRSSSRRTHRNSLSSPS
jgi:hypothetical protein